MPDNLLCICRYDWLESARQPMLSEARNDPAISGAPQGIIGGLLDTPQFVIIAASCLRIYDISPPVNDKVNCFEKMSVSPSCLYDLSGRDSDRELGQGPIAPISGAIHGSSCGKTPMGYRSC